jgi:hypothetical protein
VAALEATRSEEELHTEHINRVAQGLVAAAMNPIDCIDRHNCTGHEEPLGVQSINPYADLEIIGAGDVELDTHPSHQRLVYCGGFVGCLDCGRAGSTHTASSKGIRLETCSQEYSQNMRKGEEWDNKGLTKKNGWRRPAEKLMRGTKPWGKKLPNGELNPTPKRVVANAPQTSGAVYFSMCDETTHFSLCHGDGSSSDQGVAGSSKRKKWNQLGHGRYKVIARRDRGNPGAPWGHPNHRWARKEDGPTLDAVEAAVINRELNKDFKLNRSEGKRARLATRITERRPI